MEITIKDNNLSEIEKYNQMIEFMLLCLAVTPLVFIIEIYCNYKYSYIANAYILLVDIIVVQTIVALFWNRINSKIISLHF